MHNTRISEGGELWTAARRAKVTMTDLAAFLGVSRPTVYKYLVYKPESMPVRDSTITQRNKHLKKTAFYAIPFTAPLPCKAVFFLFFPK